MRFYELCYKPLTTLHPFYAGSRHPLEPYISGSGSIIPSIWTLAGATINVVSKHSSLSYHDIISQLISGDAAISGVYIVGEDSWRESVFESRIIALPLRGLPGSNVNSPESSTPFFQVIPSIVQPSQGIWIAAFKINQGKAKLLTYMDPLPIFTERIGIMLKTKHKISKVVEEGAIYSYKALQDVTMLADKLLMKHIMYCVTITTTIRLKPSEIHGIIDLGGKHSVAEYRAREVPDDPFLHLNKTKIKQNDLLLSVSHINVTKSVVQNEIEYVTPGGYTLEALLGKISTLYGWDFETNKIKHPTLAIEPGSILKIHSKTENKDNMDYYGKSRRWYYNLLDTFLILE